VLILILISRLSAAKNLLNGFPLLSLVSKNLILFRYYLVYTEYGAFEFRDFIPFLLPISMSLVTPKILIALKLWLIMLLISSTLFGLIGFNAAHHHPDIFHDGDIYRLHIIRVLFIINHWINLSIFRID